MHLLVQNRQPKTKYHLAGIRRHIAVCALLLVSIVGFGCQEEALEAAPVRPAKTLVIGSATHTVVRAFPGVVRAWEDATLSFRVAGQLQEFKVVAGQRFSKGDVLARLDPRDYKASLDLAKSTLTGQRAQMTKMKAGEREENIVKLRATVAAAESSYATEQAQFERVEKLYEKGDIGKADYDSQKRARDVANSNLENAQKSLEVGIKGARKEDISIQRAQIKGASAQVRSAKDAVEYTTLKAPFDGIVGKTFVDSFEEVRTKQEILTLQDLTSLIVDVDVPEDALLTINQYERSKLVVTFEGLPGREFPLELHEAQQVADPATRTYKVSLKFAPPDDVRVLPGMSATVRLELKARDVLEKGGLIVPTEAIVSVGQKDQFVWTLNPESMAVKKTIVGVGPVTPDGVVITRGLKQGDEVVVSGSHYLTEGQKIRRFSGKSGE